MAYSINPNLPKARALAMKLLVAEQKPLCVVAAHCGVHRSTIWRWKLKWDKINEHVQFTNDNRPSRVNTAQTTSIFRLGACTWLIPTITSKPRGCPHSISEQIVDRILQIRSQLKRCAEVVWHHITTIDGLQVSLSSVRRILRRHHCFDGARKNRVRPDNPRRPHVSSPGELVETDTIHYICPLTKTRRYVYTVIDLYTRMTYAEVYDHIRPGIAAATLMHACKAFGFTFFMVQADNGPEFSRYFEQVLKSNHMLTRHTRLGRPNDNAHIERFNRTIQEECLGSIITYKTTTAHIQRKLDVYFEHYNYKRVHLGIQMRTPASMLQWS